VLKLQELQEGSEVQTAGWWTVTTVTSGMSTLSNSCK
ncbi:class III lanthipeptide, partial [Bacillus thuringiensis]